MVVPIITIPKVSPKRECGGIDIERGVSIAGRMISRKLPQHIPVSALPVLLITSRIVAEQVQRRVVCLAHDVLPHHIDAVSGVGWIVRELLAVDRLPECTVDDSLPKSAMGTLELNANQIN